MSESVYVKDEYKKVKIPFGFNRDLQKVMLSLFHSFFVAMTGHGKTLGMKSLLLRFHELYPDWKILILDSKDKRDYADLNADIPICFVETTDPLDLKNLMEPVVGAKMMYYFDKIIEEAIFDSLGEIQRNIESKIEKADKGIMKIYGKELGKLRVINFTLKKLVNLIERPNITSELQLKNGFNVMPVSLPEVKNPNLKRAFQQLIVRSTLILLLSDPKYERTLLVLDENHKWNPQRYASICKQPLSEFISEGRSQDKIVWQSDQALTKIDKESLKNVKIWVVGQQLESNEVEDAVNTVNDITDLKVTDREIKTLKIGNFIIVDGLNGKVENAYLQPYGVSDEVGMRVVAENNPDLAEPYILEWETKSRVLGDDELVYKEKFTESERKRKEAEQRLEEFGKDVLANYIDKKQHTKSIDALTLQHQKELASLNEKIKHFENLEKAASIIKQIWELIVEYNLSEAQKTPAIKDTNNLWETWKDKMPNDSTAKVFKFLIDHEGAKFTRTEICSKVGYTTRSTTVPTALLWLKRNTLITHEGDYYFVEEFNH